MVKSESQFWEPESDVSFSLEELKNVVSEVQKDVMRHWFISNYENPAERTPYESKEGGYIYIWGGPYDAGEVLGELFGGYVPEDVIDELVSELEDECVEWTSALSDDDYDDYYFSVILSNTEFHKTFLENLEKIGALLQKDVGRELQQNLFRLLYTNVITSLETFLSDAFINTVLGDPALIKRFVESNSDFKKQKFKLSDLFEKIENINDYLKKYLLSQLWHNLKRVKPLYESTLKIGFPEDINDVFKAILIRHDIVHRNGKSKSGDEIKLTRDDVQAMMDKVRLLVDHIDTQFAIDDTNHLEF